MIVKSHPQVPGLRAGVHNKFAPCENFSLLSNLKMDPFVHFAMQIVLIKYGDLMGAGHVTCRSPALEPGSIISSLHAKISHSLKSKVGQKGGQSR